MTAVEWLLRSDPAIRWQAMRDLVGEPDGAVAAERSRVAIKGWGARLLQLQAPDGGWGVASPKAYSETPDGSAVSVFALLRDMGLDPTSEKARRAVRVARDNLRHFEGGNPLFAGEVEPCINGRVLAVGAYFGEPMEALLDRLLGEQLDDGGWNCEAPKSRRSSFHTTICVLDGLLEYERSGGAVPRATQARLRGQEYLLDRGMFRSRTSGKVVDRDWTFFSYPPGYHYDVLRGLDYLRCAGVKPDHRISEAIELVRMNRRKDGLWPLQNPHPGKVYLVMDEGVGKPSRWNTLRALRVLRWAGKEG